MPTEEEPKKGLFSKAIDAFSSRDEKEEIEKLQQELEAAKKAAAEAEAQQKTATAQSSFAAQQAVRNAESKAAAAEARLKALELELAKRKQAEAMDARKVRESGDFSRADFAQAPKFIAEHTITEDDTLSHVALKYYGHATRDYWMVIYEANKAIIGDDAGKVRPGMVVKIPELPANLKGK